MKVFNEKTFVAQVRGVRCRRPGCNRDSQSRGLCAVDYRVAHQLVSDGITTWIQLENHGKADPPKRTAKVWFLEYAGR